MNLQRQVLPITAVVVLIFLGLGGVSVSADEAAKKEEPATIKVKSGNPMTGDAEAIEAGQKLYSRWCVQCHGVKADGVSPRWGKHGADLRQYWRGYGEFIGIVMVGKPEKMMPPFGEYLQADDILKIGSFLETLAIEGANWQ